MTRGLTVALALATGVAGCSEPTTNARGAKGGDGTLRLSFTADPRHLNPNLGPDESSLVIGQNLFNRLISIGVDGSIIPELAERWEESPDGLTHTFHLRSDVFWHDGRPLTPEDVRLTLGRLAGESSNRDVGSRIADVELQGDRSVVVRLKEPWAAFLPSFAWYGTSILPAHVYGDVPWKDHPANLKPIGTGPFKLKSWDPGRIVLEKNEHYFGPGPYVDQLEYLLTRTSDESVNLLMNGKADLLVGRPPSERVQELSTAPHLRVSTAPADGRTYIAFNLRRAPFDDVRIRRAVNMAIDRRALVYGPLAGIGAPAFGLYTPTIGWAYNGAAQAPPFDLAASRRALADRLPRRPVVALLCYQLGSVPALAAELVRQFAAAGLRARADCVPTTDYFTRLLETRDFDFALMSGAQGPDPDNLALRFSSTGASQVMGYADAELDDLLARAARSSDLTVRARAYHRAQEILARDLPVAPLVETIRVTVARGGIRGLPQEDARGLVAEFTYNLVRLPGSR